MSNLGGIFGGAIGIAGNAQASQTPGQAHNQNQQYNQAQQGPSSGAWQQAMQQQMNAAYQTMQNQMAAQMYGATPDLRTLDERIFSKLHTKNVLHDILCLAPQIEGIRIPGSIQRRKPLYIRVKTQL